MPVEICKRCGQANSPLENELCPQCQTGLADTIAPSSDSETASSITDDAIDTFPDSFGEYDLLKEVARGGMGVIYKARHRKLNRISALKMILSGRFSSSDQMQRFHIEAEAAAQLDHPGIVPVYEIGEIDGHAFFAMKL